MSFEHQIIRKKILRVPDSDVKKKTSAKVLWLLAGKQMQPLYGAKNEPQKETHFSLKGKHRSSLGHSSFGEIFHISEGTYQVRAETYGSTIGLHKSTATTCYLKEDEKLRVALIMLSQNDLLYYSAQASQCQTYEDATISFRLSYNSFDEIATLLTERQSYCLSEEFLNTQQKPKLRFFGNWSSS